MVITHAAIVKPFPTAVCIGHEIRQIKTRPLVSSSFADFAWAAGRLGRPAFAVQLGDLWGHFSRLGGVGWLVQPTRAANSATSAAHFSWGLPSGTTSANFSIQLCRRKVVTMSWNDGSRLRRYHGRTGNRTCLYPSSSNHNTTRLYNTNATGAVRRTASGSRLAGSSRPRTCLAPSKVTSIAQRDAYADKIVRASQFKRVQ